MTRLPTRHAARGLRSLVAALILSLLTTAFAQGGEVAWELRACADPFALPFSGREEPGFENAIAEIVADELGAELTYDWIAFSPDTVNLHLREGTCDVLLGVPDGYMELASTIAYYRSPYLFVTRSDAPYEIESLDDPDLGELRIGVQNPGIPPHDALLARGYNERIVAPRSDRPNPPDRVLREVLDGSIDVGIIWGPPGGYFAPQYGDALRIERVTPLFDPPMLSMSFAMTMAVRPGDDHLRDLLERAIAVRWDEIHATLDEFGVPYVESPAPVVTLDADRPQATAVVAVVGPSTTGRRSNQAALYDIVGDQARNGALLAESDAFRTAGDEDVLFLHAVTPDAVSARRAVDRLVATAGVDVVVGGLGEGQADAIAEAATAHDLLFLDTGSIDLTVRERCYPTTLHVEADAGDYLTALVDVHAEAGVRDWFVVHLEGAEGEARAEAAEAAVASQGDGGTVVGRAAVRVGEPTYALVAQEIVTSDADGILLMVGPADQIAFIGQVPMFGVDATIAPLTGPVAQTRDFMGAERDRTEPEDDEVRVVAWEPTRPVGSELAQRYVSRFGQPMQASAFPSYQAVIAVVEAILATGSSDAATLRDWLLAPDTTFVSPKGPGAAFRAADHGLRQPVDVVRVRADAEWRNTVEGKLGLVEYVRSAPDGDDALDADALDAYYPVGDGGVACTP